MSSKTSKPAPEAAALADNGPGESEPEGVAVVVPESVDFAELGLHRGRSGTLRFHYAPLRWIVEANGHPPTLIDALTPNDIASLIYQWYQIHRAAGGAPDRVYEDCLVVMDVQDAFEADLEPRERLQ